MSRRNDFRKMTVAERFITEAIGEIEKMGADERLSKAQMTLRDAGNLLADYVDEICCKECGATLVRRGAACNVPGCGS